MLDLQYHFTMHNTNHRDRYIVDRWNTRLNEQIVQMSYSVQTEALSVNCILKTDIGGKVLTIHRVICIFIVPSW